MKACILCGATATDKAGNVKHEGACPHYMRGPDVGGDPFEWPTLLEAIAEANNEEHSKKVGGDG
jgi:hypothetical protein